ncbi:CLUMA_CG020943, isoform A [Clunio marinus]|uniref:CLUMA_CG020943, isoform A n=1 Tax=Clunio marinus TaxID=568069 RepID=A0A1J1J6F5_9DIPT|nr:CLUMA_CG020943, isoform A [Clunio marinus]
MSSSNSNTFHQCIQNYRKEYESDEHWALRKAFILAYHDRYRKDEILCLAQVLLNIELLGCKYSSETMTLINQMAENVMEVKNYREKRKKRLKRTFAKTANISQATYQPQECLVSLHNETVSSLCSSNDVQNKGKELTGKKYFNTKNLKELLKDIIYFEMPKNDLNGSLNKTIAFMQKQGKIQMQYNAEEKKYFYVFNDEVIAEGKGSKKESKKLADENLIITLKENCYTIKVKKDYYTAVNIVASVNPSELTAPNKILEDNIGFQMLKMLGWNGGSLGVRPGGIVDPYTCEIKIGRSGFGTENDKSFNLNRIKTLLTNFKNSQVEYDLVFSKDFTKDERAQIHQIASAMDFRTKSHGKNDSRHIVISSKLSPHILRQKLLEGDKHLLEKYEILPPTRQETFNSMEEHSE